MKIKERISIEDEELDEVVGGDRLNAAADKAAQTPADRKALLRAKLKEQEASWLSAMSSAF